MQPSLTLCSRQLTHGYRSRQKGVAQVDRLAGLLRKAVR